MRGPSKEKGNFFNCTPNTKSKADNFYLTYNNVPPPHTHTQWRKKNYVFEKKKKKSTNDKKCHLSSPPNLHQKTGRKEGRFGETLEKKRESNAASNEIIRKAAFFFSYACVRVCLIRLRGFFFFRRTCKEKVIKSGSSQLE
jgi:hypothetical protein